MAFFIVSLSIAVLVLVVILLSAFILARKVIRWLISEYESRLQISYSNEFYRVVLSDVDLSSIAVRKRLRKIITHGGFINMRRRKRVAKDVLLRFVKEISGEELDRARVLYSTIGCAALTARDLKNYRWWIRAEALSELSIMKVENALDLILPMVSDKDESVRIKALEAGLEIGGPEILPIMLDLLPEITLWTAMTLERILDPHDESSAMVIRSLLSSDKSDFRKFATIMLGLSKSVAAVPTLIGLAASEDPRGAACALQALSLIEDPRAIPLAIQKLDSVFPEVRSKAALFLGQLGETEAIKPISHLLQDADLKVRYDAACALARLGDEGISVLKNVSESIQSVGRGASLEVLDEIRLGSVGAKTEFQW